VNIRIRFIPSSALESEEQKKNTRTSRTQTSANPTTQRSTQITFSYITTYYFIECKGAALL
jgi:hypothetical protein